jgi:hypothetical protein
MSVVSHVECLSACETKIKYLAKMSHRDYLSDATLLKSPLSRAMHLKCPVCCETKMEFLSFCELNERICKYVSCEPNVKCLSVNNINVQYV